MKKLFALLIGLSLMASASMALNITANTANTQWSGTTTVTGGSYSTSDYMQIAGCSNLLLTAKSGTYTSTEVVWYYSSGTSILSREGLTAGTAKPVRATRAKIIVYCTATNTPEMIVYGY